MLKCRPALCLRVGSLQHTAQIPSLTAHDTNTLPAHSLSLDSWLMTISQPHFVCATPPSERWYQRLEERVHPPHAPVLAYTAATPRAAPHLATRRIHITAIFWAGGMLPRSAIVAAWCALLDSAALLYATLERLHAILPGRCANVAARVHAVLAAVDSAIRKAFSSRYCFSSLLLLLASRFSFLPTRSSPPGSFP